MVRLMKIKTDEGDDKNISYNKDQSIIRNDNSTKNKNSDV